MAEVRGGDHSGTDRGICWSGLRRQDESGDGRGGCLSLRGAFSPAHLFYLGAMPLFDIAKDIFFIRWAAGKLRTELRVSAPLAVNEWFK